MIGDFKFKLNYRPMEICGCNEHIHFFLMDCENCSKNAKKYRE